MSEKALGILSQSAFKDGIVAGIGQDIKVAHKFGDRIREGGLLQRHDCGIVYYPENPYILCVMTRGTNLEKMNGFVQNVSKIFYDEVKHSARVSE